MTFLEKIKKINPISAALAILLTILFFAVYISMLFYPNVFLFLFCSVFIFAAFSILVKIFYDMIEKS